MRAGAVNFFHKLLKINNGHLDCPMKLKHSGYIWGIRLVRDMPCIINGYEDDGKEILIQIQTLPNSDLFPMLNSFVSKS